MTCNMNEGVLMLQEVSNGLRGLVSLQQEQRAQVQYGAADGLSAADISAVVDEAGAVAHRLRQGLDQLWRSFATPAAVSPRALQAANSSSGEKLPIELASSAIHKLASHRAELPASVDKPVPQLQLSHRLMGLVLHACARAGLPMQLRSRGESTG